MKRGLKKTGRILYWVVYYNHPENGPSWEITEVQTRKDQLITEIRQNLYVEPRVETFYERG